MSQAVNVNGAKQRKYFTPQNDFIEVPSLIAHQKQSFDWFTSEGLAEIFQEVNPIEDYTGTKLELRFKGHRFEAPKTTEREARENNVSYEAPLRAVVELTNKVTGEVKEQEIYLGDYPWMTDRGTFVINGAERVVVSQLIRSAGVFFTLIMTASRMFTAQRLFLGVVHGLSSKPQSRRLVCKDRQTTKDCRDHPIACIGYGKQ
jgi:DNA-directed RNA polymerase subunit beta